MFYWELDLEDMCFFDYYTRVFRFHHSTFFLYILTLVLFSFSPFFFFFFS